MEGDGIMPDELKIVFGSFAVFGAIVFGGITMGTLFGPSAGAGFTAVACGLLAYFLLSRMKS